MHQVVNLPARTLSSGNFEGYTIFNELISSSHLPRPNRIERETLQIREDLKCSNNNKHYGAQVWSRTRAELSR